MWLLLLRKFWPWLAGVVIVVGSDWYFHHSGYISGYASSQAQWQTRFAEAERARDAANAKARQQETESTAITQKAEADHEKDMASLTLRAADAEQRIRALGVRLAAASARRCEVPAVSGAAAVPDAARASAERAERAAASIGDTGRRCEADAIALANLQRWLTEQKAVLGAPATP
jgi:hypothetical protein